MTPLFKPYMPQALPELETLLHSGALAYGKYGRLFESQLAEWIGCSKVLVTNSFNSAALVLVTTLGLRPGDEIIASPMCCLASTQPFATQGIKVKWADIDPHTGTLCPDSVRRAIGPSTKAIFHNHFCGYVGYVSEIETIAREHGLYLVDDAIEAFGSLYGNKRMGALNSDATLFSFQTVRLPDTIDGGAIAFNNPELAAKAAMVRDYGIDRSRFRDGLNEIARDCDISLPGFGATPSDINSYIGSVQMPELDSLIAHQRENFAKWTARCLDAGITPVEVIDNTTPNGWIFGMLADDKEATIRSWRKKGFYASGVHLPNTYYSVFGRHPHLSGVAEFYSKFVALPCGWWVEL